MHGETVETGGEVLLELTLIGNTAILAASVPDELELKAALAFADVKWKRRRLLEDLAGVKRAGPGDRLMLPRYLRTHSEDQIGTGSQTSNK